MTNGEKLGLLILMLNTTGLHGSNPVPDWLWVLGIVSGCVFLFNFNLK